MPVGMPVEPAPRPAVARSTPPRGGASRGVPPPAAGASARHGESTPLAAEFLRECRVRDTVSIHQVQQILQGAERRGEDVDVLLRRAGIAPGLLRSSLSRVSVRQYAALISVLRRSLRDELWGLCERPLPLGSFEVMVRAMLACPSLGEALRLACRVLRSHRPGISARCVQRDRLRGISVRSEGDPAPDPARLYAMRVFAYHSYRTACWLVGRRIPLRSVVVRVDDRGRTEDMSHLFDSPVCQDALSCGWFCEPAWLDMPIVQTTRSLDQLLAGAPASLIVKYRDEAALGERVRRLLKEHLGRPMPSQEEAASRLALTPKTLNRHLHREGVGSYRRVRDAFLRDVAIDQLTRRADIQDITALLGFSEPSTFHRAFKGWTGVAPGMYRRNQTN